MSNLFICKSKNIACAQGALFGPVSTDKMGPIAQSERDEPDASQLFRPVFDAIQADLPESNDSTADTVVHEHWILFRNKKSVLTRTPCGKESRAV